MSKSTNERSEELEKRLREVVEGRRGFVSLTAEARDTGTDRADLIALAESLGLTVDRHGRFGYCAVRK